MNQNKLNFYLSVLGYQRPIEHTSDVKVTITYKKHNDIITIKPHTDYELSRMVTGE